MEDSTTTKEAPPEDAAPEAAEASAAEETAAETESMADEVADDAAATEEAEDVVDGLGEETELMPPEESPEAEQAPRAATPSGWGFR